MRVIYKEEEKQQREKEDQPKYHCFPIYSIDPTKMHMFAFLLQKYLTKTFFLFVGQSKRNLKKLNWYKSEEASVEIQEALGSSDFVTYLPQATLLILNPDTNTNTDTNCAAYLFRVRPSSHPADTKSRYKNKNTWKYSYRKRQNKSKETHTTNWKI